MHGASGTPRRGALFGLLIVFAMMVMVPSVALAYTAKYSSVMPTKGSSSLAATPTVSVTVYAPYGVKGSTNYSMYVDGVKVKPSIKYLSSRYRKFKLTYRRTTPLQAGLHKVTVKVKDLKRRTSSYSWSFTVLAPPPPPPVISDMSVTIASNDCLKCHVGYPTSHPMTACASCHGPTGVLGEETYGPGDTSAHTASCSAGPCHGGGGSFPHVLSTDCMACHDGRYSAIPIFHGGYEAAAHVSTQTFCAGPTCHDLSLTVEHFKYSVDGEPLDCETCHINSDPKVTAGLKSGSADCSGCHDLVAEPHPGTAEAHAYPVVDCGTGNGCHKAAGVVELHKGSCTACHTPGRTLTTRCASCHPAQPHPDFNLAHTAGPLGCTTTACHSTNVIAIHTVGLSSPGCAACHAEGRPPLTLQCASVGCHPTASGAHSAHPVSPAAEVISIGGVSYGSRACADCHTPLDLIGLHSGRCVSCHGAVSDATMAGGCSQTGCHASGPLAKHAGLESAHALAAAPSCVGADCHSGGANVAALHASKLGAGATAPGCAACHGAGKTPTVVCATAGCHSASDAHPITGGHPKMTAGHTTGLRQTCVTAGCHASDLAALHADADRCATCHGAGKTLAKDCATSGCHSADVASVDLHPDFVAGHTTAGTGCTVAGCHAANAISIHTGTPSSPGCAACHGTGKPALTLACGTAGCHPTPSPAHDGHPVTVPDARITIGGTDFGLRACSECHTPVDLIDLHGASCASCHGGAASTATFAGGCAQGSCHTSGSLAMHGGIDAAHTLDAAPSCAAAGCHAGGTNLAALHASTIGGTSAPGCATCHAAGAPLTATCSTVGCHSASDSRPINDPHPKMTAGHTASLPLSCVSAGCHASDLPALHRKAQSCATCHAAGTQATKVCATAGCHPYAVSSTTLHPTYVTGHTAPGTGCTTAGCHNANVITLHVSGPGAPGCRACHDSGKPALTLVCATAGCHSSAQAGHESHPVSPAAEPVTISGVAFGSHACSECHTPLDLIDLHASCASCHGGPASTATFAGGCAQGSCHTSGALAKHATIDAAHAGSTGSCTTGTGCHSGGTNVAAVHKTEGCATCHAVGKTPTIACATAGCHGTGSTYPVSAPHPNLAASHTSGLPAGCVTSGCHAADLVALHAAKNACATCHWNGKVPTKDCSASGCHTTLSSMHTSHPSTVTTASIKINTLTLGTYACTTCHESMDLLAIHKSGCGACHPGAATAVGTWDKGCAQAACHGATSQRPMHGGVDAAHTLPTRPNCSISGCHIGNSRVPGDFALLHFMAPQKCRTCHSPGSTRPANCADCHEQWKTGDHKPDHQSCNDCHAPYEWDPVTNTPNLGAKIPHGVHWGLFDWRWTVLIGRATIRPGYPYGDYTGLVFPGPLGGKGPYVAEPYYGITASYDCATCHTGAGKEWIHPAYNYFTCGSSGDCHEHHYNWDPAQGSESYVHNTPPASWKVPSMRW